MDNLSALPVFRPALAAAVATKLRKSRLGDAVREIAGASFDAAVNAVVGVATGCTEGLMTVPEAVADARRDASATAFGVRARFYVAIGADDAVVLLRVGNRGGFRKVYTFLTPDERTVALRRMVIDYAAELRAKLEA